MAPAVVRMPDGQEYRLRVIRPHAESAELESKMVRLSQLWEESPAGDAPAKEPAAERTDDRVERHRLLEEAAIEIIDCPPDLVRQLHPIGQTRVVQLYYRLQREALDPTDPGAAPDSAASSTSPSSSAFSEAPSPSGSGRPAG